MQQKMSAIVRKAILMVAAGKISYAKFLSSNDTGKSLAHQCGVLISKKAKAMMFDKELPREGILSRWVTIHWLNLGIETNSRFIYYSSKGELRITNFSKGFPFLRPDQAGSLFVFTQNSDCDYSAIFLFDGDEISDFLTYIGISTDQTNDILPKIGFTPLSKQIEDFVSDYYNHNQVFPTSQQLSEYGRLFAERIYGDQINPIGDPDHTILIWEDLEFQLFRDFESKDLSIRGGLINILNNRLDAYQINSIMNRRKSRAGKSLENQLSFLFRENSLSFTSQGITEERKKPDFIFPSIADYHNPSFPSTKLISLAAKTTCKDRWRQVITEADRIPTKYLCTLQKGLSTYQMEEMKASNVILVVPKPNFANFPSENRHNLLSIKEFIEKVKATCL